MLALGRDLKHAVRTLLKSPLFALVAVLVKAALRGERPSAVQSATGFYYLAVVTAFTAEVAVKTRFLDPSFA